MKYEKTLLSAVLCFLVKDGQILLARKTKKIGEGRWNGFGGGIEKDETRKEAVVRELEEESGLVTKEEFLEKVADVFFHNTKTDGSKFVCRVHIYFVHSWEGELKESDEMRNPTWFKKTELPFNEMMPADRFWLAPVLEGKKIVAKAKLGPFQKELLEEVRVVEVEAFVD